MYDPIRFLADGSKLIVEGSSLSRDQKEFTKLGIDCAADIIKLINSAIQENRSNNLITLQNISLIKYKAIQYGLDRITLFPCPVNGSLVFCWKMDGGNITAFCSALGIPLLPQSCVQADDNELAELIRQYGLILYLKES